MIPRATALGGVRVGMHRGGAAGFLAAAQLSGRMTEAQVHQAYTFRKLCCKEGSLYQHAITYRYGEA